MVVDRLRAAAALLAVLLASSCACRAARARRGSVRRLLAASDHHAPSERCGDRRRRGVISQTSARFRCGGAGHRSRSAVGRKRDVIHARSAGRGASSAARGARRGCSRMPTAVPVPLPPARGFNQATELARAMGLPVVDALVRARPTPSQTDLPAAQRHRNVRGAFRAARPGLFGWRDATLRGRTIVLVDDVSTIGATLEACAAVLKAAGAREVRALTAARVVLSRP
jgi:predicted amidophosphoribosyltransferase